MRNLDGFKKLLELGADPNVVYGDGNSVMHAAVNLKDLRILRVELKYEGNPNLVSGDSIRKTPIFDATSTGYDVVDLLLEHGADINARDIYTNTPLLSAAWRRDFEIAYRLLIRGADYTLKNEHGDDLAHEVASTVG
jgi:ankyrin repeat protein